MAKGPVKTLFEDQVMKPSFEKTPTGRDCVYVNGDGNIPLIFGEKEGLPFDLNWDR